MIVVVRDLALAAATPVAVFRSMIVRKVMLPLWASLMMLAGCAVPKAYLGEAIERTEVSSGYRSATVLPNRPDDGLLLIVSFSGGGMRASAMAYGLLEQMAADRIAGAARSRRMIDEIDVLSAVSGGAIPAAYFALHGERLFTDFRRRFLEQDVGASLRRQIVWSPRNWLRLASSEFSRGDLYAEYFDRRLFGGATFGDLVRNDQRPLLLIHATDIARGSRFEFTQDSFDPLCIDLARYPLARAVAASSSVSPLFTPITVRNRSGVCGAVSESRHFEFLHLVDGALSDNLGVRGMLDALMDENSPLQKAITAGTPRRVVYITMNAGDSQSAEVGARRQAPAALQMLRLMGTVAVDRYSADSRFLLPAALREWTQRVNAELHYVELELESLRMDPQFGRLVNVPTTFALDRTDIDGLRCAAGHLLHRSAEYHRLIKDFGGQMAAWASCQDSTYQVSETPLVLR